MNIDLTGKVAVVTGASGGIGKEIARGLAARGATVVLAVRDVDRAGEVARELGRGAIVMPLDVSDVASVRSFAAALVARHSQLHYLVNNAGAWFTERRTSAQGIELTFATNVLGPHYLTSLLAPTLVRSRPARIVNVVSSLATAYDADDLEFERRSYDGFKAYGQSKLALRMLTWGQALRFESLGVTANAVAPGFVRTELNRHARGVTPAMINVFARLMGTTPAKGAAGVIRALLDPALEGVTGRYFDRNEERDGKFRDRAAIDDLERRCEALVARGRSSVVSPLAMAAAAAAT